MEIEKGSGRREREGNVRQNKIYSEAKPNRPPPIVTAIDADEAAGNFRWAAIASALGR